MNKQEFETLAGYRVADSTYYNVIEKMYMAVDTPKPEFVKMLNRAEFAIPSESEYTSKMQAIAGNIKAVCDHYTPYEMMDELEDTIKEFVKNYHPGAKYMFSNKNTLDYIEEGRGCAYPAEVLIYNPINFVTLWKAVLV